MSFLQVLTHDGTLNAQDSDRFVSSYCDLPVRLVMLKRQYVSTCVILTPVFANYHVPNSVKSLELCPTMNVYRPVIMILQF